MSEWCTSELNSGFIDTADLWVAPLIRRKCLKIKRLYGQGEITNIF